MTTSDSPAGERLQKVLARAGFGSRRKVEEAIGAGQILLNRKPAQLGDRLVADDRVVIEGKEYIVISDAQPLPRVLIYNKPEGEICTHDDPGARTTVFSKLPRLHRGRWLSIGRLDINTLGLLLLTDNGELANGMAHPSRGFDREYAVRVHGKPSQEQLDALLQGVLLEDGPAKFESLNDGGGEGTNHWYQVVIKEGRNREVRRLWESQGLQVSRLIRVRYGSVELPRRLPRGQYTELDAASVKALQLAAGLAPIQASSTSLRLQLTKPRRRR